MGKVRKGTGKGLGEALWLTLFVLGAFFLVFLLYQCFKKGHAELPDIQLIFASSAVLVIGALGFIQLRQE